MPSLTFLIDGEEWHFNVSVAEAQAIAAVAAAASGSVVVSATKLRNEFEFVYMLGVADASGGEGTWGREAADGAMTRLMAAPAGTEERTS